MKIDTVLFDMDGTLLDTIEDLHASVSYALERAGLPPVTQDETRLAAGYASVVLIDKLTGHRFDTGSLEFKRVWSDFMEHYGVHHSDRTKPYEGMPELLEGLKSRGVKMAVVSNKAHRDTEALRQQWFSDYIPVAVGFTDELPKKPAPDMVYAALKELESTPQRSLYVGDSEPDCQIAKNSGCTGVAVTWGFRTRETLEGQHPDYIIDFPADLLSVVDSLQVSA